MKVEIVTYCLCGWNGSHRRRGQEDVSKGVLQAILDLATDEVRSDGEHDVPIGIEANEGLAGVGGCGTGGWSENGDHVVCGNENMKTMKKGNIF